jgi:uncharacterized protein
MICLPPQFRWTIAHATNRPHDPTRHGGETFVAALRNAVRKKLAGMSDHRRLRRPWCNAASLERENPMSKMIFVNLPVTDLPRAVAFYEAVGATKNPQFSDDTAACMVFSDTIHAMLLTHDKYKQFTSKKIVDAKTSSEVLICVSADSRDEVDGLVDKAKAAGGGGDPTPVQDFGFMYGRSYEDPDGHIWEVMWMDMAAAEAAMAT